MPRRKKKPKNKSKNEFRYNNETKHINFIFEQMGNKYHSLGLTHKDKTFGKSNMPLNKNPKLGKSEKAYIRNGVISSKTKNFSKKPIKNMHFDCSDLPNIKSKIRHYKKKRKKNK